jgi:cell division protein FtsB
MKYQNSIYSAKNVVSVVVVFGIFFWLLYSIGSFLHESQKINQEIEEIRKSNALLSQEIEEKQKELEYLKTPQRIAKEAKMQMGRKEEGERVIVFIEEKLPLLPTEREQRKIQKKYRHIENWKKWELLFFGDLGVVKVLRSQEVL